MKILFVSIPNHHFFQWANQLKNAGYEVHWFDITDGAGFSNKINWVIQYNGWKLLWNYPGRYFIKRKLPHVYNFINNYNTQLVTTVFEQLILSIKPDIIHCFEMNLSGIPILSVLEKYSSIKLIYSSWGSDMYDFKSFGLTTHQVSRFLYRTDYLITDCHRDYQLALSYGFANIFLGVFPGNGGIQIAEETITSTRSRNVILVKGYDDGVGKASVVLHSLEQLPQSILSLYEIIVFSAEASLLQIIKKSTILSQLNIQFFPRNQHIKNEEILKIMGKSVIYIGNSISDGMPLLEAMGMGAFPIQSNPGKATEEVIADGKNGFLIENPLDVQQITNLIEVALKDEVLRKSAQEYNVAFINENYNRVVLQPKIVALYYKIFK